MHSTLPPRAGRSGPGGHPRWLAAALIVVGVLFNVLTPPEITFIAFFVAAPLATAALDTLRTTAVTGATATVVIAVLLALRRSPFGWEEASLQTLTVLTVSALALIINAVVARRDRRVASAREVAEAVQRAVVPDPPERIDGMRVAARYHAAQRDALIGGDMYAVRQTPYGVRGLVGDVRGKGLGATEAVAVLLGAFREAATGAPDLPALAARLEAAVTREAELRTVLDPYEGFTTAVLVEIPADEPGRVRVLNRGHPPPLLLSPNGWPRYLTPDEPALPLGLGELGSPGDIGVQSAAFPPGAQLLLYTDGVTEARDAFGAFYEPSRGLRGRRFQGPDALLDTLMSDVIMHTGGGLKDDMAMMALNRPLPSGTPVPGHGHRT